MDVAIAAVGACIAVGAAVVNGIVARELERAMAPEAQATTDGAPTADASAWAGFHAARERQIADYWARRSRILPRQAELKESATRLGARRERTSNLAVSLQILGPPVVLTRDVLR
jgi:hypothetical protein